MKRIKILLHLILIILSVGIANKLGEGVSQLPLEKRAKVAVYYVPVTNYFSRFDNFSSAAKQEVYVRKEDKGLLADKFSGEALEWTPNIKLKEGEVGFLPWNEVSPELKALSFNNHYLWDRDDFNDYELKIERELTPSEAEKIAFDPTKLTKINFLGDIMLSRHVNTQMERFGYEYPWLKVRDKVADADITFANLEVPISDRFDAPSQGMSFVAPTKNLAYLKEAGIDVVSVANNHTANFGLKAFTDNLANLKKAGIQVCGGGLTEQEARGRVTINRNKINFSFLCQSAITGSLYAEDEEPGVPYLGIEPWYRRNQNSLDNLIADINKAREGAVLIDSPHWGVEYKQYPNSDQQKVARLMIENGVDLIMGTHPHVVQSVEYYKGKYINYSLGNFIFDQEWSPETKQGVMVSVYFYGEKNLSVSLVPLQIENYAQPRFVGGDIKNKIINEIRENSIGF